MRFFMIIAFALACVLAIPRTRQFLLKRLIGLALGSPWLINWLLNTPYVQEKKKGFSSTMTEYPKQTEAYPIQ